MNWRFLGPLSEARKSACSGVYLIVHQGLFDRVVYVGVSNNVGRRISEHYDGYLRGNRTIYNAGPNDDVYKFMSAYNIHNHIKYYQGLANQKKIWASTTIDLVSPVNLLSKKQQFDCQWKDILLNKYLPQLVVWVLPLTNFTYDQSTRIESVIQTKIIKAFDLRGFFNVKKISILGKIERPYLKKISQCISSPELDSASKIIFDNLDMADIPEEVLRIFSVQLDEEFSQRLKVNEARLASRKNKILLHENYGKPWTNKDQEKLRVMLVDFEMKPSHMAPYLGRDPRSIAKRIRDNDKLSHGKWRQDLKWL